MYVRVKNKNKALKFAHEEHRAENSISGFWWISGLARWKHITYSKFYANVQIPYTREIIAIEIELDIKKC